MQQGPAGRVAVGACSARHTTGHAVTCWARFEVEGGVSPPAPAPAGSWPCCGRPTRPSAQPQGPGSAGAPPRSANASALVLLEPGRPTAPACTGGPAVLCATDPAAQGSCGQWERSLSLLCCGTQNVRRQHASSPSVCTASESAHVWVCWPAGQRSSRQHGQRATSEPSWQPRSPPWRSPGGPQPTRRAPGHARSCPSAKAPGPAARKSAHADPEPWTLRPGRHLEGLRPHVRLQVVAAGAHQPERPGRQHAALQGLPLRAALHATSCDSGKCLRDVAASTAGAMRLCNCTPALPCKSPAAGQAGACRTWLREQRAQQVWGASAQLCRDCPCTLPCSPHVQSEPVLADLVSMASCAGWAA